ncbi:MFS transporter [Novosphingobium sp. CECT 9465]|uniref:MFS transporter n=1 Tax=Novosphingobium sp. CECT 9465 TaxID=2829794 RepID=UPI001E292005|nr:MFS transporter [Novosphingobium sp. CECT 9465]CAH0495263.1 sugar efflux transporter [Novosphingobium sp. CECT 9465]
MQDVQDQPRRPGHGQKLTRAELSVACLMAAVQFFGMTDSMVMIPLGPVLSQSMAMDSSDVGYLTGTFVAAACIAGLASSVLLDRLDRRRVLLAGLGGLSLMTALTGLASGFHTLIVARFMAGLFAGPTMATTYAILADHIAASRRGRAMGIVATAFGVASVLGVPVGLQLALVFGWSMMFVVLGAVGAAIALGIAWRLGKQPVAPPTTAMTATGALAEFAVVFRRPAVAVGLCALALHIASNMLLIPNMASFMAFNLGYPVGSLGVLWMAGGVAGLLGGNIGGRLADRFGTVPVLTCNAALLSLVIAMLWFAYRPGWPLMPVFAAFVMLNLSASAMVNARVSTIPPADQRGRFASLQVATQHASTAVCSVLASLVLASGPGGVVFNMGWLAVAAILSALAVPVLLIVLNLLDRPTTACCPCVHAPAKIMEIKSDA